MKNFFLVFFFLSSVSLITAQNYLNETSRWNVLHGDVFDNWYTYSKYGITGDTIIGNKTYHKVAGSSDRLYLTYGTQLDTISYLPHHSFTVFIREDSARFFLLGYEGEDILIYDFNLEIGDAVGSPLLPEAIISIDSFYFNSSWRKKFITDAGAIIYEGIGTNKGLFDGFHWLGYEEFKNLNCYSQDDDYLNLSNFNGYGAVTIDSCTTSVISANQISLQKKLQINCYPNPVSSSLFIELKGDKKMERLSISNYNGNILMREDCNGNTCRLNMQNLPKGFYFLVIEIDGKKEFRKIIKL